MFLAVNSAILETPAECYVTFLFGVISSLLFSLLFMFFLLLISKTVFIVVFSVWTSRGQWWLQRCLVFLEAPRVWAQSCWTTITWSQANWSGSWLTWKTDALPSDTRTTPVDTMFFTNRGMSWTGDSRSKKEEWKSTTAKQEGWSGFFPHLC